MLVAHGKADAATHKAKGQEDRAVIRNDADLRPTVLKRALHNGAHPGTWTPSSYVHIPSGDAFVETIPRPRRCGRPPAYVRDAGAASRSRAVLRRSRHV